MRARGDCLGLMDEDGGQREVLIVVWSVRSSG